MFTDVDVFYSYTRCQAFEDGVLVDVTNTAKEAGFKFPVAVTQAVWESIIVPDERLLPYGQSEQGRLWDMLNILKAHCIRNSSDIINFKFYAVMPDKNGSIRPDDPRLVALKSICGPGDNMEPVITVMLPNED